MAALRSTGSSSPSRARRTSARAKLADAVAERIITLGGAAVLAAVLGICVYLVYEVAPLFGGADLDRERTSLISSGSEVIVAVSEGSRTVLSVDGQGVARYRILGEVEPLSETSLAPEGRTVTALSRSPGLRHLALGLDDGSLVFVTLGFESTLVSPEALSAELKDIEVGDAKPNGDGAVLLRPEETRYRITRPELDVSPPLSVFSDDAVGLLDYQVSPTGQRSFVATSVDGEARFGRIRVTRPLDGGAPRVRARTYELALEPGALRVFVEGGGAAVFALDASGMLARFDTSGRRLEEPVYAEENRRVLPEGIGVASAEWLLGSESLLLGGTDGTVRRWFVARDGPRPRLVAAGEDALGDGASAVVSLAASPRGRVFAVKNESGSVVLTHATSEKRLAEIETALSSVGEMFFAEDGQSLLVVDEAGREAEVWWFEPGHAEASFRTLFGRVQYEGQASPSFTYQSSAGDDAAEVKLSLTPLIFGTLKATLFCMLIAAPIAVFSAIYSSEFLSPSVHRVVKPTLELMASLPSVVLGFVAAFVVAPFVARSLPAFMIMAFTVPLVVTAGAHFWTALPERVTRRFGSARKLCVILFVAAVGLVSAWPLGSLVENVLFRPSLAETAFLQGQVEEAEAPEWIGAAIPGDADEQRLHNEGLFFENGRYLRALPVEQAAAGDLRAWLSGTYGGAFGGWVTIAFGPAILACVVFRRRVFGRQITEFTRPLRGGPAASVGLGLLAADLLGGVLLALGAATVLDGAGLDPRDSLYGVFNHRNTLVVGMIMALAVIPIIYTISDDALRSVPDQLRSASLGAGATPWQTAVRVVLPVAASGIFSAVMIGLGRAVGETMIVLMATGNTPVMDWNLFSGFRTLAANIAVELPEAPKGSTHYRVLFLCGFVLFVLTFLINTSAEIVRQSFRKRSASL